jgi:hypothetical protein
VFDYTANGWFIATLIIDLVVVAIVMVMFIVHKCYWEPCYVAPREDDTKALDFERENWENKACDAEFL